MGETTEQELKQIRKTMSRDMVSMLMSGSHFGHTVLGKTVTKKALRTRGLLDEHFRWTAKGWALAVRIASSDEGWNPDYFATPDEVHAAALEEDAARALDGGRYFYSNEPCSDACWKHRNAGGRRRHLRGCIADPETTAMHAEALEEDRRRFPTARGVDLLTPTDANAGSATYVARRTDPDVRGLVVAVSDDQSEALVAWGNASSLTTEFAALDAEYENPADLVRWEDRHAATTWEPIDEHGSVRCSETGIEVRAVGMGAFWEVLVPVWRVASQRTSRISVFIGKTKIEALGHADREVRPELRAELAYAHEQAIAENRNRPKPYPSPLAEQIRNLPPPTSSVTAPGFRGGRTPSGWTPEHTAKIASEIRSQMLTAQAFVAPGSLADAAAIVDRVVKRAQCEALRAVLAEVDEWGGDAPVAGDIRQLLNRAARKLGTPEPSRPAAHVCQTPAGGCTDCPDLQ